MKGVVATGDRLTARAAAQILEEGGNAFDAACAAMLAAPLCEPMLTSLGGGGFMLTYEKGRDPLLYDFFVNVPVRYLNSSDFFPIYVDFGTAVQEFHIGAGAIAVPGMIAGIDRIHRDKGTLPMERIAAPAIRYASEGIRLNRMQAGFVKLLEPILLSTKGSAELFAPRGKLIDENDPVTNPDYAAFLEAFSREGAELFYQGEIAETIDRICRKNESHLRIGDLASYRVETRKPVLFGYRQYGIVTNPPPSAGGILIAFVLKMLENTSAPSPFSEEYVRELIEAMVITADFRKTHINPHLHDEGLEKIIRDYRLLSHYELGRKSRLNLWGNTTHISIIDALGNCASVTSTNGEGSGIVIPGTGIMLNNMLGEEDLNPHGFFAWPTGVRLPSMMAPTIVLDSRGDPALVLGSAGSNRIRSAISEVIDRFLTFGETIESAVNASRIHYENGELFFEPGYDAEIISKTKRLYKVTEFKEKSLFFGGVNAVTGKFEGGADPRRGGAVEVVQ